MGSGSHCTCEEYGQDNLVFLGHFQLNCLISLCLVEKYVPIVKEKMGSFVEHTNLRT